MYSAQQCRDQSAECLRLIRLAHSDAEARVLRNLWISWSKLAGQIDRYDALVRQQRRRDTAIARLLVQAHMSLGPEEIGRLKEAYMGALLALHLLDREDPEAEIVVAKKIIEVSQTGINGAVQICQLAIQALEHG
jgi:hypothetical protein